MAVRAVEFSDAFTQIYPLVFRYLHGDLTVTSMEGYGTDAHVFIKAISKDSHEKLPIFNKTSSKHYNMVVGSNDWSSPISGKNKYSKPLAIPVENVARARFTV